MFSLIGTRIIGGVNNGGDAGDLRRYLAHYDVTVVVIFKSTGNEVVAIKTSLVCIYVEVTMMCRPLKRTGHFEGVEVGVDIDESPGG